MCVNMTTAYSHDDRARFCLVFDAHIDRAVAQRYRSIL